MSTNPSLNEINEILSAMNLVDAAWIEVAQSISLVTIVESLPTVTDIWSLQFKAGWQDSERLFSG